MTLSPDRPRLRTPGAQIRVMLVDDSAIIRRLLGGVLDTDPAITIAGHAVHGHDALDRLEAIDPDVVVLDIEMPVMDGLTALRHLKTRRPGLPVIMFSTLTERGASATLDALTLGADDYVTKPSNTGSFQQTAAQINAVLVPKIKALHQRSQRPRSVRPRLTATPAPPTTPAAEGDGPRPVIRSAMAHAAIMRQPVRLAPARPGQPPALIVIGVSTGGPNALAHVIPNLPASLPVPVLVTQHMPPIFTKLLAERLNAQSPLQVAEAVEGAEVLPGQVWFAQGGQHLCVRSSGGRLVLSLDDGPAVHSCKPAVDPMFVSAVSAVGDRVLGVILTGMGNDGLDGAQRIREAGGRVILQDEATSVVWGMPGIAARAGIAERILPLDAIAPAIVEIATGPPRRPAPATAPHRTPSAIAAHVPYVRSATQTTTAPSATRIR